MHVSSTLNGQSALMSASGLSQPASPADTVTVDLVAGDSITFMLPVDAVHQIDGIGNSGAYENVITISAQAVRNPGTCPDADGDLVCNALDNCPTSNPDQADIDGDGVGDVCDNCPNVANPDQADADDDGIGNLCEGCGAADVTGDGVVDIGDVI